MKEYIVELDPDDLEEYRRLYAKRECGIMYNVPLTLQEATEIELQMIEFQHAIFEKYLAGEDLSERDWHIDEITGVVYLWG